jgi:hypothetical protein
MDKFGVLWYAIGQRVHTRLWRTNHAPAVLVAAR